MIPYKKLKARIERDKAKKVKRRQNYAQKYDCLEKVFTPRHYIRGVKKCRKNVSFKLSVQKYTARPFGRIDKDCASMLMGISPPIASSKKEVIHERGHERIITPIKMQDRVNQRVLCDYALTPMITRSLIYDNGASLKDKGVSFARARFNGMLERAKRWWGDDFYVLSFDIERFFDNIPHYLCYEELNKIFSDKRLVDITMQIVEGYQMLDAKAAQDNEKIQLLKRHEGVGICLGSHVSQLMALCVPNFLDHYIKDSEGIKLYERYMDDGVIIHNDKTYLKNLLDRLIVLCKSHGLNLKVKKTHITHIRKGITFLKIKYSVRDGKTVKRLPGSSSLRMRRKLKKFAGLVKRGKMNLDDVYTSLQSWLGHTRIASAYRKRKQILALYNTLFGSYRMKKWRCLAT